MNSPRIRPATRDAIVSAALEAFARDGSASMSEIALRAGVSRATLHRHFRNREDLLDALSTLCIEETNAAVAAATQGIDAPSERLRSMFRAIIPLGDRYAFLYAARSADRGVRDAYDAEIRWVAELVRDLQTDGAIPQTVPASWVVTQIDQLVWTAWREVSAGNVAASMAADLAMRTLFNGLGGNHDEPV